MRVWLNYEFLFRRLCLQKLQVAILTFSFVNIVSRVIVELIKLLFDILICYKEEIQDVLP